MTYNKPLEVAKVDLKMALKVRYVKYSLIGTGLFGPIIVIIMIISLVSIMPVTELGLMMPFLNMLIAPMLAIFAVIPTTLIAANSLVGERELKTMEPLLCTPLTDRELLWGKTLSSVIPSLAILFGSTIATVIASWITFMAMGAEGAEPILIPDVPGLFLLFTAGPLVIFAVVGFMIILSGRVTRVYEAYQSSSAVVMIFMIPMFMPLINIGDGLPSTESAWLGNIITTMIAAVMFVVCWAIAFKLFNRDRLISLV
jgi:ABC-type transport system involved in multi-copper enzyme maturation permease subunit